MNLQRGLLSIHDRWLPVCIYLHTTRSYVYIWTSYLYLTFTDIHIQIGIRGVPEFRRQNFRNLLELRWNEWILLSVNTSFHLNFGENYRIGALREDCRSLHCFVRLIITDVSVSIRLRLLYQYREKEKYSLKEKIIFNKKWKKIYKWVLAPWGNFCRQARDKHPVYLYTYHRFVYASKRDCVFSTRFSRIRSFVYVCMFREYTCMSVCIHIWCAFVYACVFDGTVIHFTRIGESSSSNRLVIDAASFALSRLVIPPLRLYLLFSSVHKS